MNITKKNKFNTLQKLNPLKRKLSKQIFSFDFETILFQNIHVVTCFSIYGLDYKVVQALTNIDAENHKLKEESQVLMAIFFDFLKELNSKNANCLFICHNFGKFDSAFIIEYCCNNNISIDLIARNNIIYKASIFLDRRIDIHDSYLMFPVSLNSFCEAMNIETQKLTFEFNITKYSRENIENLKLYCLNDSKLLYFCFLKLRDEIFDNFKIDITRILTLSSLALKIFLTHFYDDNKNSIQKTEGSLDTFIRESYFGGVVDVFKPFLTNGFCYDINSLYPSCMLKESFPIGTGKWMKSEEIDLNNFFGFLKVDVFCPSMYRPILPLRKLNGTMILPIGHFSGVYFSEEIKFCINYGYKFDIKCGIAYKKGNLFEGYVTNLYKKRISSGKKVNNLFYKLLLNSLYGRFGMSHEYDKTIVTQDPSLINQLLLFNEIKSFNRVGSTNWTRINYNQKKSKDKIRNNINFVADNVEYVFNNSTSNTYSLSSCAVQIASSITSYARIKMFSYKECIDNKIFYCDTDSLFTTADLSKYVSNDIGSLKLEYKIDKAYFLSPKFYYVKTKDGDEIIKSKGLKYNSLNELYFENAYHNIKNEPIEQINFFARDSENFLIYKKKIEMHISGDFTKRLKIFDINNKWIDTSPIKI